MSSSRALGSLVAIAALLAAACGSSDPGQSDAVSGPDGQAADTVPAADVAAPDTSTAADGGGVDAPPGDASLPDAGSPDAQLGSELPPFFRLEATASGNDGNGTNVECSLDLHFELRSELERTDEQVTFAGVHGGAVFRSLLDETGAGTAFHADSYSEMTAQLTFPDRLRIRAPINDTADGRFWRELATFEATIDATGNGTGTWRCAPFDVEQGGYVDTEITIEGTFTLTPEEIEPEPPKK